MWLNGISIWSRLLISNRWREPFFSCIILSVPYIQGEALQCSLHLYFQMLPLTSQPNSFSPPPLCLPLLCWHRVPMHSYPSHIWSFVFPIKGEIYSIHSYFLYFKPASGGLQMNEGVVVVSARLSGDHLAHLIKHRGFNLVFRCTRKTTFTPPYTAGACARTGAGKHVFGQSSSSHTDAHSSDVNFFFFLLLANTSFLPCFQTFPENFPQKEEKPVTF